MCVFKAQRLYLKIREWYKNSWSGINLQSDDGFKCVVMRHQATPPRRKMKKNV